MDDNFVFPSGADAGLGFVEDKEVKASEVGAGLNEEVKDELWDEDAKDEPTFVEDWDESASVDLRDEGDAFSGTDAGFWIEWDVGSDESSSVDLREEGGDFSGNDAGLGGIELYAGWNESASVDLRGEAGVSSGTEAGFAE